MTNYSSSRPHRDDACKLRVFEVFYKRVTGIFKTKQHFSNTLGALSSLSSRLNLDDRGVK